MDAVAMVDWVLKKAANEKAVGEGSQGLCTLMRGRERGKPVYMCACLCVHVGREIQHMCVCTRMCPYAYLHVVCRVRFQKGSSWYDKNAWSLAWFMRPYGHNKGQQKYLRHFL